MFHDNGIRINKLELKRIFKLVKTEKPNILNFNEFKTLAFSETANIEISKILENVRLRERFLPRRKK
jgi:hypothetical protein